MYYYLNVPNVVVVIPAYKVAGKILDVVNAVLEQGFSVIVVDDKCPQNSGRLVDQQIKSKNVTVIYHSKNGGVGAATKSGYLEALRKGAEVVVKIDGDGQMDTTLIAKFVEPILSHKVDYVKGNRFGSVEDLKEMPPIRLLGNMFLSFVAKLSTGYWKTLDPNNGFTAINFLTLRKLPLDRIDNRYFFETDMLFRLGVIEAKTADFKMKANYADEKSNLRVRRVIFEFAFKHLRTTLKRIFYKYYILDFRFASFALPLGLFLFWFGILYGLYNYTYGIIHDTPTSLNALLLIVLTTTTGLQLLLYFITDDIGTTGKTDSLN
jgi:dolichol-phosphate mannosyltransferase